MNGTAPATADDRFGYVHCEKFAACSWPVCRCRQPTEVELLSNLTFTANRRATMNNQACGFFVDAMRNLETNGGWDRGDMIRALLARGLATLPSEESDLSQFQLTAEARALMAAGT